MEKLLKDRLNALKSKLSDLEQPKLTKIVSYEEAQGLRIRIDEIQYLISKHNKSTR